MEHIKIALNPQEAGKSVSLARFEELFEISYFPQLVFDNWDVEQWMRKRCTLASKKGKIRKLALWLGAIHGHQIEAAEIPDVTIRWIGAEMGYGLFTNRPLKKWEFIGEYTGTLRRRHLFFPNINDYCFMYPQDGFSFKSFTIDSQKVGNYTRFINHNDAPNCESAAVFHQGMYHIIFRSLQDIPAEAQLTYDYGNIYWNRRKKIVDEPINDLIDPDDFYKLKTKINL